MKTSRHLLLSALTVMLTLLAATPSARAQAPGSLDALDANVVGTAVEVMAMQPDGKTIIAGAFTSVLGVPRSNIARLNTDGSLDMGFDPKANIVVYNAIVQTDGKILIGGFFTTLQPNGAATPTARSCIARVNADGSLDMGFDPKPNNSVFNVTVQTDGKILLAGGFTTLQPNGAATTTARQYVARLNADGSLDLGFDPKPNGIVDCMAVQADGKILLGGRFTTLQPNGAATTTPRSRIARLNADGCLDTGFDPSANGYASFCMSVQADAKILLGGEFSALQPNGAATTTIRHNVARVNADGSLDPSFDPNANGGVLSMAVQADGEILLGGLFTTLQPNGAATTTTRNLFARLNNDAAIQTFNAPDATQMQWQRGGASAEVSLVTFEKSIDGGANWTTLGNGTRIGTTPNWQITGLSLPSNGKLRARGRTASGIHNASSGMLESVVNIGPDIAVEQPVGAGLVDGAGSVPFYAANVGGSGSVRTFTIKNTGNVVALTGLAIAKDGTDPGDFTVSAPGSTTLTPGNSTTFTVTFTPGATGPRSAAIHLASNVAGASNPFDIGLTGTLLSFATDTDGDGLSDASEFQMAALGFDWQVGQPALVNTLTSSLNGAGYFTTSQVQALNVGVPLIQRNPATGVFTLTIGVRKTTGLSLPFSDFPMNAPGTTTVINGQGKLEFGFTVPDDAAFFRLEAQ